MKTPLLPAPRALTLTLVPAAVLAALLLAPGGALARNNIRTSFFTVYPSAVGTVLDTVPSKPTHCGVCHFDFNGGGARNPYGLAIQNAGFSLNQESGRQNAINAVANLDSDGDGFTNILEINGYNLGYTNIPTFPGYTAGNVGSVTNVTLSDIVNNLTPTTNVDNTPPTVTVLSPNGGETLVANQPTTITWTASDAQSGVVAIRIYESIDGGATWKPLVIGIENTGSWTWFPANRPTLAAKVRVQAFDGAGNNAADESNAFFSIISPPGGRAPTTLRDFDMPGTQPFEGGPEHSSPQFCGSCHGGYDAGVEPYFNWQGSMMAMASLDPLFEANLAIANQDAPDSGDLCLRCHIPNAWLQGRSVPTNGGGVLTHDKIGVSCDFCHRMVDPDYVAGLSPARDADVLALLSFPFPDGTPQYGNGMYVVDSSAIQRGPFNIAPGMAGHPTILSPFHKSSALCGTCHDVSNPAFNWSDITGKYELNALNTPNADFSPESMAPVERTYSEWLHSAYNTVEGVLAPQFAGNKWPPTVSSCQDCHMRAVAGYGAKPSEGAPFRQDIPLHDMTGGSTWIPGLIAGGQVPGVNPANHPNLSVAAAQAGITRATYMLQNAADLGAEQTIGNLVVRVTNQTGHKLPTGYPEGRRIWLNVRFYDAADQLIHESGAYDPETGVLTKEGAKIYEVHPGIDENISGAVGVPVGKSFHFVLNNAVFKDNRIPPRGFTNAAFALFGGAPVNYSYADGQYWDDTPYTVPAGAVRAEVKLYYQSTGKEFVEFLKNQNTSNSKGDELYQLWDENGKCPPTLMASASYSVLDAGGDFDGDGLSNIAEHAFGSDPYSAGSAHRPVGHSIEVGGVPHVALSFIRRKDLTGAQIVVEVSTDLQDWHTAAPAEVLEHSVTDNHDGTETVVLAMAAPLGAGERQFMRLRVSAQ